MDQAQARALLAGERARLQRLLQADAGEPQAAELGDDVGDRLAQLAAEPANLAALQLAIVGGYYTDRRIRDLIGYPGQMAIELRTWEYPQYLEEGLIDAVLARGPVWRDPATGQRAVVEGAPQSYAERFAEAAPEGGT